MGVFMTPTMVGLGIRSQSYIYYKITLKAV